MDPVKDAFSKVKQDIKFLKQETKALRQGVFETRKKLVEVCKILQHISRKIEQKSKTSPSTHKQEIPTSSTHPSTHNSLINPLKPQNMPISTGNAGVPTDRQTDRQTDKSLENLHKKKENAIDNAVEILDSLDDLKKEIRLKFKRLTEQELLVFSTIYQLEEEQKEIDYRVLAQRLKLTESSIRDYVGRLIRKGIPVEKNKINNKTINLSISKNLKKIATLPTILQLREL